MIGKAKPNWTLILVVLCLIAVGTGATFLSITSLTQSTSVSVATVPSPTPGLSTTTPVAAAAATASPELTPASTPSPAPPVPEPLNTPLADVSALGIPRLIIPVLGIKEGHLRDTFNDARSESRSHNALDIMAPQGATVIAAADGFIAKLHFSDKGGITIYQTSVDLKLVYYYAHLDHYKDGIAEGQRVRQGDTIGFVGDTGNAGAGNYHLHFAIWTISDPKRYWDGVPINPYPLLRSVN